jgi:PEP-CTERM motif
MKNIRGALGAAMLLLAGAASANVLATGDIAFTAFNSDEDGFALVTLIDLAPNTQIYFSDNEVISGGSFNTGEGALSWSSGATTIAAGTVIRFLDVEASSRSASFGSFTGSQGSFNMSGDADAVYAYLGSGFNAPTSFLTAISSDAAVNLSFAGLASGSNAVQITASAEFAQYTGTRGAPVTSFAGFKPLVFDSANWAVQTTGNFASNVPDTTIFAPVPEPSTVAMLLAGLVTVGAVARRRGRSV